MATVFSMSTFTGGMIAATIFSFGLLFAYCTYIHPLRDFPGPALAKLTNLYSAYFAVRMDIHLRIYEDHLKYGPVIRHGPNKLLFNSPRALHDIYNNERVVKSHVYKLTRQAPDIGNVFNIIDKQAHRSKRRFIGQAFNSASLRKFEPTILAQSNIFFGELLASRGGTVNMTPLCQRLTMDLIALFVVGYPLRTQVDSKASFVFDAFALGNWQANVFLQCPALRCILRFDVLFDYFNIGVRAKFLNLIREMVHWRLQLDEHLQHDLYSLLFNGAKRSGRDVGTKELWSETVLFIFAGVDTITSALSALFFYLSRNKASYAKLAEEIRTCFEDSSQIMAGPRLSSCRYLRACIDETLRLTPPVPGTLWREVGSDNDDEQPWIVDGHVIPKGTQVAVSSYSLHHNVECFPQPFEYVPERWLESDAESLKHMRSCFAPFSTGSRVCIGKDLAYLEVTLVMAKTLWYFDFEVAPGQSGELGAGREGNPGQRSRPGEFQTYDRIAASHDGPNLVFSLRDSFVGQERELEEMWKAA